MQDISASQLKRGNRVWIGCKGWRSISSVRYEPSERWLDGTTGPGVRVKWRGGHQTLKPDAVVMTERPHTCA